MVAVGVVAVCGAISILSRLGMWQCYQLTAGDDAAVVRGAAVELAAGTLLVAAVVGAVASVVWRRTGQLENFHG